MKKISLIALMVAVSIGATFAQKEKKAKPAKVKPVEGIYAKFETTAGNFTLEVFYEKVPMTSANFIALAEGKQPNNAKALGTPYFDGLKFHRVISKANGDGQDFMIQGGDPDGNGRGGPGYAFKDEFVEGLKHDVPGILSMANAGPGTNGSQFFVTIVPTPWLDNKHTVFGKVTEGQDVVNNLKVNTVINKVSIIRVGKNAKKFDAVKTFNELSGGVKASNPKAAEPKGKGKKSK